MTVTRIDVTAYIVVLEKTYHSAGNIENHSVHLGLYSGVTGCSFTLTNDLFLSTDA